MPPRKSRCRGYRDREVGCVEVTLFNFEMAYFGAHLRYSNVLILKFCFTTYKAVRSCSRYEQCVFAASAKTWGGAKSRFGGFSPARPVVKLRLRKTWKWKAKMTKKLTQTWAVRDRIRPPRRISSRYEVRIHGYGLRIRILDPDYFQNLTGTSLSKATSVMNFRSLSSEI